MNTISVRITTLIVLVSLLASCVNNATEDAAVTAQTIRPNISVQNNTLKPIFTFIVGAKLATRISWSPSLDESIRVNTGQTKSFDLSSTFNNEKETKAIVYWWVAVEKNGEKVPGEIHNFAVDLNK